MSAVSAPAPVEASVDPDDLNHYVNHVGDPTWCGLDSRGMEVDETCVVDCPICVAVSRGEL